jgi:hypothetical protein
VRWVFPATALLAACTRRSPEPPRADPVLPAAVADAAPARVAAEAVDAGPIVAWTDERAIAELASSCAFVPQSNKGRYNEDPLACTLPIEQACIADPCFHEDAESCKSACDEACTSCGGACVRTCDACKTGCAKEASGDGCRRRCAQACGACRQGCLSARDRCRSADCTQVYTACRQKLVSEWLAKDCDRACSVCDRKCGPESCTCWESGPAKACNANPMLCPEMFTAPERRELDPKWKANHCDEVCAKVWKCAQAACEKTGCEPASKLDACAAKAPQAGACGIRELAFLRCRTPDQAD